jgi:hypothetical protein
MSKETLKTLYWLLSLGKAFIKNAPLATLTVMTMSFLSQLCMMIAFLLPIKVVMLLGSSDTIRHLPEPLQAADKDLLILLMGITTLLLYGAMHLTQRLSDKASKIGVQTLLEKNQKLVLFENQNEIARNAYSRFAEGLAAINFSLFGLLFLSFIYSDVAMILALSLIIFISGLTLAKTRGTVKDKPEGLRATQMSHWLTDFCFMSVFVYIVLDFLYLSPPVFILAIVAIILTRILLGRLQFSLNQFIALVKQKHKINALMFHHHSLKTETSKNTSIWDIASPSRLGSWLQQVVGESLPGGVNDIKLEVRDSTVKDVVIVIAMFPKLDKQFLVKLFGRRVSIKAIHEASLILDYADQLPTPPIYAVTMFEQHHCHIFDISDMHFEERRNKSFTLAKQKLMEKMALVTFHDDFLVRYEHSKPYLWNEINQPLFNRLESVSSASEQQLLSLFRSHAPKIRETLKSLPLTVNIPIKRDMVLYHDNTPLLFDWTKWTLSPLGAGLETGKTSTQSDASIEASTLATSMSLQSGLQIMTKDVELSYLVSSLLMKYESQCYREIIEQLIPRIISNRTQTYEPQYQFTSLEKSDP